MTYANIFTTNHYISGNMKMMCVRIFFSCFIKQYLN